MMKTTWLNILIVVFVTLGSFSYGYCASIIASTLGQPRFLQYFGFEHNDALLGATNGLFQTGGFFGALLIGPAADRLSRRGAIVLACVLLVIGGALQAGSVHVAMFLVMRTITGVGVGLCVGCIPLYQSEISPPKTRGFLVALHGMIIGAGYSIAGWVGYACYPMEGDIQWRLPLGIQCIPPGILIVGVLMLPESPRWLLQQDRSQEALEVVKKLHGSADDDDNLVMHEFTQMREQLAMDKVNMQGATMFQELMKPHNLKRIALGFITMFGAQCTGTLVINNYGVSLYSSVGYEGRAAIALTAGWVTVSIPGNLITAVFVDRVGRVRFLIIGFVGTVVALIGEMVVLSMEQSYHTAIAAIFFLYMHVAVYGACIDATTYIYVSEIFPTRIRAIGSSLSISGLFLASLTFTQSATTAFASIEWKFYLVFTVASAIMIVLLFFFFPETKGLSLEDIGACFNDPVIHGLSNSETETKEENEMIEMV
ncbi:hypothetical protein FE257_010434 [Aspergillus nanangensis]|uniref:Major facilitator superfamily (MFS) profile domain-containing protein n=1 Tax=Aspergillus nanangensis TaxID=2582783 RepID=A0AAD4CIM9_ASPNN|nr:hypothetical protein FE257_010434 [Aspergillus nanangensis]